ncbi:MAG TPA: DUF433 domain-containing protein [Stellaceae bacterium]|nr:DUF433 domain-containing protein [Stellaceae bacterium]
MPEMGQFTVAEAAFVLGEPVKAVKKALDAGPMRPVLLRRTGAPVRAIGWPDLFYLFAVRTLREELTPKARAEFYRALQRDPVKRGGEVRFGRYRIAVTDLIEEVERRTAKLAELIDKIALRNDGEAVLKGGDVEVYRIAALLAGGLSVDQVLADYPSLSRDMVETARAYAEAYPKPGRPYPRTTVKRALQGAGLEALDEVFGDDDATE